MQVVMWFAGLRGAIAFALALIFPIAHRPVVVTTTLAVVLVTTFVCGGLTEPLVSYLGMKNPNYATKHTLQETVPFVKNGSTF